MPSNCSQISVRTVDVVNEVRVILCATWPKSGIKSTFFHNWNLFCKGSSLQFCIHQKNPAHFQMDPKGLPYCSFTSSCCSSMFGTVRTASMSPVASSSQPQIPVTLHSAGLCVHWSLSYPAAPANVGSQDWLKTQLSNAEYTTVAVVHHSPLIQTHWLQLNRTHAKELKNEWTHQWCKYSIWRIIII